MRRRRVQRSGAGAPFGFLPLMDAYEALQAAVDRKVNYGARSGLHPLLRAEIAHEAVRVF